MNEKRILNLDSAAYPKAEVQSVDAKNGVLLYAWCDASGNRIDSGNRERPWRAPNWLIGLNTVLAFVNALFLGAGAKVWGYENALWAGLIFAALIIPVFWFRHYVQDGGKFPKEAYDDLGLPYGELGERKAGMLPYVALLGGAAVVLWANWFFVLPA